MSQKATGKGERLQERYQEWELSQDKLGFMVRALVITTLPHSNPKTNEYVRDNGAFSLALWAHPKIGLPYGSIPRLLMAWISTEALKTNSQELILGDSLSQFMRELDLVPTGGRWGSITRLKTQMKKLFACHISCVYDTPAHELPEQVNYSPVEKAMLWWDPINPEQKSLWKSAIYLNGTFFEEIKKSSIVFKMNTLKYLRSSSMALDLYLWSTYRNSYIQKTTKISWSQLQLQFGAGYPKTAKGRADFKRKFLHALKKISAVYPAVNKFEVEKDHLLFVPGHPDVPKKLIVP